MFMKYVTGLTIVVKCYTTRLPGPRTKPVSKSPATR